MAKEICISSTPHETRLAILEDDQLTEIYYERENEYTLAGSIYKGRVTRVLPGMQSAFVDLGLERDAFLYVTDFMEEQEDSADFEKVPNGTGAASGGNAGRSEAQPARDARPPREPRENRGSDNRNSENRNSENRGSDYRGSRGHTATPVATEPEIRQSASGDVQPGASKPAPEGGVASGEDDLQGTRRWRGRRGRRRGGRSGGPREASGVTQSPVGTEAGVAFEPEFQTEVETGPVVYEEAASHGGGQAAYSESSSLRSEAVVYSIPSATQPIVLPGESLSRYGAKPAESQLPRESRGAAATPVVSGSSYKPKTLVEELPGWDGGAELPGESLSRHRSKPVKAPQAVAEGTSLASSTSASSEIVRQAWHTHEPEEAPSFQESLPPESAAPQHEAASELSAPVDAAPAGEVETLSEATHEPVAEAPVVEAPVVEAAAHERDEAVEPAVPVQEVSQEETHFEPEHASASYRIDPAAPSEYRLSPVLEEELEAPVEEAKVDEARVDEAKVEEARVGEAAPASEVEVGHSSEGSGAEVVEAHASEPKIATHETEFAPIPTGEAMAEEQFAPEEISSVAYEEAVIDEAAAPEAHFDLPAVESADPLLENERGSAVPADLQQGYVTEFVDEDEESANGPLGFAPGTGTLEEELIDEEEFDSEPLRAFAEEQDLDDLEEETLDNLSGAEISEMVRDAHLEQRIGASPDGLVVDDEETEFAGEVESDLDDEEEDEEEDALGAQAGTAAPAPVRRDGRTDDGRRGSRGPRRRGRPNGPGGGGGSRRANSQLSDLPIISELLKQGQEILVQIAKEPIAKKGARITSHIALPGRFLVFMPTVNHVGVSRKISSDEERQRLKRILSSEKGTASGGFIVRTAADGASEEDLRADIRFLISLWNDIKQRADDGKAPALIYHDLNLIERVLRDQVSANFSTIWVDNEAEYERIVRFLNRFEPSLVRRVKLYTKETPLFEQFGIQEEIGKALKSKVWLKSGGSIVINQTEALVAIDINTGKYVGKTARLEDTIVKTNLDAISEIVRQIRLRDLGGIIVIDFIDMDDRKNRHRVLAALEEELKLDRAPSKVLQFNDFGLVAITRKRVKQSLERTLSVQCEVCAGTGMVKSPTTVCNEIYTELRKMQKHLERGDVMLRVNPEVVKTLKANNAKWLNELEEMTGKTIIVKSDPALHPEQFDIH
jgi:ribonuclease E